jgi:hypothetical protein
MKHPKVRRIKGKLTPRQQARLRHQQRLIEKELPELIERDRMGKEAANELTFSGELRRAIHASQLPLTEIAIEVGISPLALSDFLTGERTLRSDVLDRLMTSLGLEVSERS